MAQADTLLARLDPIVKGYLASYWKHYLARQAPPPQCAHGRELDRECYFCLTDEASKG